MPKLAVFSTIAAAYHFVFTQPLRLLRTGGIWLAIVILVYLGAVGATVPWRTSTISTAPALILLAVYLLLGVVSAMGLLSFSLAWHRAVLFDEDRGWIGALRFGRREWRFLGYGVLLALLIGVPCFFVMRFISMIALPLIQTYKPNAFTLMRWMTALSVVLNAIVWIFLSRLMLVFPAVAAQSSAPFEESWERSRGNWVRLYFGSALCVVPFIALPWLSISLLHLWHWLLGSALNLLELAVAIAFYSFAYDRLAAGNAPAAAPAPQPAE